MHIYVYRHKYTYRHGNTVIHIKEIIGPSRYYRNCFFLDSLKTLGFPISRVNTLFAERKVFEIAKEKKGRKLTLGIR